MSIKKAMAAGLFLEKKKEETVEFLADSIGNSFALLANIEPSVALNVLEQLNEQFDEKIAEELIESNEKRIEEVASKMNFTTDDLEE